MPIKPIDLNVLLPKIQKMKSAKQTVINKQDLDQQQSQKRINKNTKKESMQVNKQKRKEHDKLRNDGERSNKRKHPRHKKKKNSKKNKDPKNKKNKKNNLRRSSFDIKI